MHWTPPFLDLSQALEMAGDEALLRELVATFQDSLHTELRELKAAFAAQDAKQVGFCLHALKGFMPLFCVAPLAQAVIEGYQQSRQQPLEQTEATFQALWPALEGLQSEVKDWLGAL